jgi:adenylate cyclase
MTKATSPRPATWRASFAAAARFSRWSSAAWTPTAFRASRAATWRATASRCADLRDPLSAVNGYTEMLIEESRESGRTSRIADLERVQAAARQLLDLSNDIVAIATQAPGTVSAELIKGATLAEGVLAKIRAVQEHDVQPDRQGRLLVVDDSPLNRDLLAKQLARKGYFVAIAENGNVALELMAEQAFDLVLLDVLMPELDGVGVLLRMKADDRLCEIPVIMLSALDEVDSVVRCLELGAADFVSKPFHPTLLDARINSALNASAGRASGEAPVASANDPAIERLMAGTLPDYVLQRLRKGETRLLDGVANAAVYFVDIDQAVASADPAQRAALTETLIELARRAAAQNGAIVLLHGIGLAMAAGFPQTVDDAAERMARTALMFSREAEEAGLRLRSGLHAGAVYAAVVGSNSLSYFVWGDGVDLSRRLALSADRGTISMSAACHALLKDHFVVASRGVVEVAGHGQMRAYVLEGEAAIAR